MNPAWPRVVWAGLLGGGLLACSTEPVSAPPEGASAPVVSAPAESAPAPEQCKIPVSTVGSGVLHWQDGTSTEVELSQMYLPGDTDHRVLLIEGEAVSFAVIYGWLRSDLRGGVAIQTLDRKLSWDPYSEGSRTVRPAWAGRSLKQPHLVLTGCAEDSPQDRVGALKDGDTLVARLRFTPLD